MKSVCLIINRALPFTYPVTGLATCLGLLTLLGACGGSGSKDVAKKSKVQDLGPKVLMIEAPAPLVRSQKEVEILSETVTNSFALFGDKIFIRDWGGVSEFLTEDFQGHGMFDLPLEGSHPLALGATTKVWDLHAAPVLNKAEFMRALEQRIGNWRRLDESLWKVRSAEFKRGDIPSWGRVQWAAHLVGITTDQGRELVELQGMARVERGPGNKGWKIGALEVTEVTTTGGGIELFDDVTRASGVHHEGVRYGTPENSADGWNGIASADVNGDGYWDVFVPSPDRSFLYLGKAEGGFEEGALEAGLLDSHDGMGVLFFDFENDGDQDLLVGHVGWRGALPEDKSQSIRAYLNDGSGKFTEATKALGLDKILSAVAGLTALDVDGDGFLDVYVSCYGRMGHRSNNTWKEATNGYPDILLKNKGGQGFEDVGKEAGIEETGWTYGAVAADFDEDGDTDIYALTTFGSNHLWDNQGDGTFVNVAKDRGVALRGNSMGVSVGDPNEDGHLDLFLTNPSSNTGRRILERFETDKRKGTWDTLARMAAGNVLLTGNGQGEFEVVEGAGGASSAGWAWGQVLADLDLDGHQDSFCVNGFVTGDIPRDT